jgi:hypothetical protein
VTLDDVDSTVAAVTATVIPVSPTVVPVAAEVLPKVETPDVMVAETPDIIGMITGAPVVVVAVVVTAGVVCPSTVIVVVGVVVVVAGGTERMVLVVPEVGAPLSVPAVPELVPAKLGNCQAKDMRGVRLRVKMRFLIFNMMIL